MIIFLTTERPTRFRFSGSARPFAMSFSSQFNVTQAKNSYQAALTYTYDELVPPFLLETVLFGTVMSDTG
jgi:hypothetical protein